MGSGASTTTSRPSTAGAGWHSLATQRQNVYESSSTRPSTAPVQNCASGYTMSATGYPIDRQYLQAHSPRNQQQQQTFQNQAQQPMGHHYHQTTAHAMVAPPPYTPHGPPAYTHTAERPVPQPRRAPPPTAPDSESTVNLRAAQELSRRNEVSSIDRHHNTEPSQQRQVSVPNVPVRFSRDRSTVQVGTKIYNDPWMVWKSGNNDYDTSCDKMIASLMQIDEILQRITEIQSNCAYNLSEYGPHDVYDDPKIRSTVSQLTELQQHIGQLKEKLTPRSQRYPSPELTPPKVDETSDEMATRHEQEWDAAETSFVNDMSGIRGQLIPSQVKAELMNQQTMLDHLWMRQMMERWWLRQKARQQRRAMGLEVPDTDDEMSSSEEEFESDETDDEDADLEGQRRQNHDEMTQPTSAATDISAQLQGFLKSHGISSTTPLVPQQKADTTATHSHSSQTFRNVRDQQSQSKLDTNLGSTQTQGMQSKIPPLAALDGKHNVFRANNSHVPANGNNDTMRALGQTRDDLSESDDEVPEIFNSSTNQAKTGPDDDWDIPGMGSKTAALSANVPNDKSFENTIGNDSLVRDGPSHELSKIDPAISKDPSNLNNRSKYMKYARQKTDSDSDGEDDKHSKKLFDAIHITPPISSVGNDNDKDARPSVIEISDTESDSETTDTDGEQLATLKQQMSSIKSEPEQHREQNDKENIDDEIPEDDGEYSDDFDSDDQSTLLALKPKKKRGLKSAVIRSLAVKFFQPGNKTMKPEEFKELMRKTREERDFEQPNSCSSSTATTASIESKDSCTDPPEIDSDVNSADDKFIQTVVYQNSTGEIDPFDARHLLRQHLKENAALKKLNALQKKRHDEALKLKLGQMRPGFENNEASDEQEDTVGEIDDDTKQELQVIENRICKEVTELPNLSDHELRRLLEKYREQEKMLLSRRREEKDRNQDKLKRMLAEKKRQENEKLNQLDEEFYKDLKTKQERQKLTEEDLQQLIKEHLSRTEKLKHSRALERDSHQRKLEAKLAERRRKQKQTNQEAEQQKQIKMSKRRNRNNSDDER
ncbi:unnamed protein product [Owenia fusiformis]|uniref:Uncharacterized protein n=1 Tax=Owenia fusiformis TaxID=6347 RepID=A0A8S4N557_OWEFU|nr:unnamed protein product [Owenia fusiformis]